MQTSPADKVATGESNYEKYKKMFTNDKKDTVSMDSFYKLLVAEMSNQDPLEPTSNTEFISQLATFTSLQAQQDNFALQKQNYANSLVGQTVSVQPDGKADPVVGVVEHVNLGKDIMVCIDGREYKLESIKRVYGFEHLLPGSEEGTVSSLDSYGAFAAGILGKTVTVQGVNAAGELLLDSGTASSLEIQDGIVRVIINGLAYNVTDIVSVTDAVKVKGDEDEEDEDAPENAAASGSASEKPADSADVPADKDIEDDTPDKVTEITEGLADRTDEEDIPDLIDPQDETPAAGTVTDPANGQTAGSENENVWLPPLEAEELRSLFGD